VAPSGELRGKGRCGVFAGKTVWSTPERLRGEVLTTRRYTNVRLPLPLHLRLLHRKNRLMKAGRIEQASAIGKLIGRKTYKLLVTQTRGDSV